MNSNFVIMGLPASGKTTFLAALWHLVESNETPCRLECYDYRGDFSYLNSIAAAWRSFKPVPRTSQTGDMNVSIMLRNRDTGESGVAFFPDLAGETFDRQVEERRCYRDFVESFSQENGVLFFISADLKEDNLSITDLNARLPINNVELGEDVSTTNENESKMILNEWEPKFLPWQVKIVQLLSDLTRPPFLQRNRRIAILISAWDLVRSMGTTPQEWLSVNMPLVEQFLKTNVDYFNFQIFGVSAQGGRLDDNSAIDEAAKGLASRRIQIVGPQGEGHDLTEPLVWLMTATK